MIENSYPHFLEIKDVNQRGKSKSKQIAEF